MDLEQLNHRLEGTCYAGRVMALEQVDSTNTRLRAMAGAGAAEHTVLLARAQTAGRGTGGRSFYSPAGEGLYLSVLLRPKAPLAHLFTLTGRAAVAVRRAIQAACGAPCQIKWLNDIYLNGRKVCGILTELSEIRDGGVDYAVLGVGVNLTQTPQALAAQGLGETATSLYAEGYPVGEEALAAAILVELDRLWAVFPKGKEADLEEYRAHCLTLGRRVRTAGGVGIAAAVEEDFALVVEGNRVFAGQAELLREDVEE